MRKRLLLVAGLALGSASQLRAQQGAVLRAGETLVLQASRRAPVAEQRTSAPRYANRAIIFTLALGQAPAAVTGIGVAHFTYNAASWQLQEPYEGPGSFAVEPASGAAAPPANATPLPGQVMSVAGQRRGPTVQLSWRTASELQSRSFEVPRRAPSGSCEALGFVTGQGTMAAATSYAFCGSLAPATQLYYYLRLLDQDGTDPYSPVAAVAEAPAGAPLTAWPQPARG